MKFIKSKEYAIYGRKGNYLFAAIFQPGFTEEIDIVNDNISGSILFENGIEIIDGEFNFEKALLIVEL